MMQYTAAFDQGLVKYQPLRHILAYDDFDRGFCGWVDLTPNFTLENFEARESIVEKKHFGPIMLSTASFGLVGTHGSMDGIYSLKLCTRPEARPYEEPPAPGGMSHAIKRLTVHRPRGLTQIEMWFAYTPEMDRSGLSESSIRAFGTLFDVQDDECRYFIGARYVNSVNGAMKQRWQYAHAADVTNEEWAYGTSGDWCKRGVDPLWYGRRRSDGSADSWQWVEGGEQQLCYNESDDKINWLYLRFLFDAAKREYVELQSGEEVYDLRGLQPCMAPPYARIRGLLNPLVWIETDTNRRVFLYVDSVCISTE